MRLVHIGSAVIDYIYRIDQLPKPGAEKIATSHQRMAGGGFNMMVAARRAGMEVVYAGRHGTGRDGDALRKALIAEDIALLLPVDPSRDTGNCVVIVTDDTERTFISSPGAEAVHNTGELATIALRPDDWVFLSGYTLCYQGSRDVLTNWIEQLGETSPFIFDPAPIVAEIPPAILKRALARTNWLSCNETEATAIAGSNDGAFILSHFCPRAEGIVIRRGARGADLYLRDGTHHHVPGFDVVAVDTNGAGDTHIGAFISALGSGRSPFEAVNYANAAAAIAVTRHGGASAPFDAEIRAFMAERGQAMTDMPKKALHDIQAHAVQGKD